MKSHYMLFTIALISVLSISHASEYWTGDGGKGIDITIYAPDAVGLADNQMYLPNLVQGELVSNFSSYSAISVLDWVRHEEIFDKLYSDHYDDNAKARQALGNLTPTTYFMDGKITKTATGYHLQMNITRTSDIMTTASYSGTFTFWELNNLTGIRRTSLDLLKKMGVTLTAKAQEELSGAATENHARAQTALAQGITAQRQGTEVAALSYYFQAATFDPSMSQAVNRSSILNANIASGNIGDNVRNDIAWRRQWVERLKETEQFFDNFNKMEAMPYTLFYSNDIKQGAVNYQNETVNISIETYLYGSGVWTLSIERALQAVWDGLNATGRKEVWELGGWPRHGVTNLDVFASKNKNFWVVFELVNNQNKVIGKQTLQAGGSWGLSWSDRPIIDVSSPDRKTLNFQNVNANDITDNLSIRVASVNGTDAETAAINGVLQIKSVTKDEVVANDRFRFAKGEIQGYEDRIIGGDLVIPNTIWGDPVISIGNEAFRQHNLPDGIKGINSITIGANVAMTGTSFQIESEPFRSFSEYYRRNGKRADTYIYNGEWLNKIENEQKEGELKIKMEEATEQKRIEKEKQDAQLIRLGLHLRGGYGGIYGSNNSNSGSKLFGTVYNYEEMGRANSSKDWHIAPGLMLNLWITRSIAIASELNYSLVGYSFCYGCDNPYTGDNSFINVDVSYQTAEIPVLLRWRGFQDDGGFVYFEAGFQWGFPISSKATVSSGKGFPYGAFKDNFSDFRPKNDYAIVFGFGLAAPSGIGFRWVVPLTKLDKYSTVDPPVLFGFSLNYVFY